MDIEAFCAGNLTLIGEDVKAQADQIRTAVADEIEAMPLYRQIILIEGHFPNQIHGSGGGHFISSRKNLCEWGINSWGLFGTTTMQHEEGHRVDFLLGKEQYYSDLSNDWKVALNAELGRTPVKRHSYILTETEEKSVSLLYPGSRTLSFHLGYSRYTEADYPVESFAEMVTHHTCLHRDNHGDEARVDAILSAEYPDLWPVFREQAIPAMKELANSFLKKRAVKIESYTSADKTLHDLAGMAFDPEESRRRVGLLLASNGTSEPETEDFKKRIECFNLVSAFVQKSQALAIIGQADFDEVETTRHARQLAYEGLLKDKLFEMDLSLGTYNQAIDSFVEVSKHLMFARKKCFSEKEKREEAISTIRSEGPEALAQKIDLLQQERKDFMIFQDAMKTYARIMDISPSGWSVTKFFDEECNRDRETLLMTVSIFVNPETIKRYKKLFLEISNRSHGGLDDHELYDDMRDRIWKVVSSGRLDGQTGEESIEKDMHYMKGEIEIYQRRFYPPQFSLHM